MAMLKVVEVTRRGPRIHRALGFLVGLASALMGVSGGSMSNMILTLYGKTIHQAVAI